MKAASFIGNGIVKIVEKPVPEIKDDEILIKVAYCGLCGSEKRILQAGFSNWTPGHEISGTVERCGSKARQLEKGLPVLIYLSNYCGECSACKEGNTSQCENRRGLIGWHFNGGYAEYVAVPQHMVYPLGDIPLDMGVIALDTVGTAFHGLRQAEIEPEHSVLVIGCGPIGLGCVGILKNYYGIKELYAADVSQYRCKLAEELGAKSIPVDPADTSGSIEKVLGSKRIDRVIEVCGLDASVAAAAKFVHAGGKISMIGEPEKALTLVRSADWVLKDFALINSWYFPTREIVPNLEYMRQHMDEVKKLATHVYPIDEMQEAYRVFHAGLTGKVLIKMD